MSAPMSVVGFNSLAAKMAKSPVPVAISRMVSGGTVQGDSTKYCYDDDPWYCENGWGGLYTWSNAMNFPAVCDSVSMSAEACSQKFVYPSGYTQPQYYVHHQGICPEGWHVASEGEWAYLQHTLILRIFEFQIAATPT